jgi:nitrogenase subunit NifH
MGKTVIEADPDSEQATVYRKLAKKLSITGKSTCLHLGA